MYQQNYIPMPYIILIIYKNKSVNFFKKIIKIILIFFFFFDWILWKAFDSNV